VGGGAVGISHAKVKSADGGRVDVWIPGAGSAGERAANRLSVE